MKPIPYVDYVISRMLDGHFDGCSGTTLNWITDRATFYGHKDVNPITHLEENFTLCYKHKLFRAPEVTLSRNINQAPYYVHRIKMTTEQVKKLVDALPSFYELVEKKIQREADIIEKKREAMRWWP